MPLCRLPLPVQRVKPKGTWTYKGGLGQVGVNRSSPEAALPPTESCPWSPELFWKAKLGNSREPTLPFGLNFGSLLLQFPPKEANPNRVIREQSLLPTFASRPRGKNRALQKAALPQGFTSFAKASTHEAPSPAVSKFQHCFSSSGFSR